MTKPRIHRLILWLSLAGIILSLHLWIQKTRGFDQGCLGLSAPQPVAISGGCRVVNELAGSHLFGIPNAALGYAFYFTLSLVSLVRLVAGTIWSRRLDIVRGGLIAPAWIYSAYLVYQMAFVARAWCVLCLASAVLVTLLAVLQLWLWRRKEAEPADEHSRTTEFRAGMIAVFGALGVLIAVLVFIDRLGTRPLDQGSSRRELEQLISATLQNHLDNEKLQGLLACRFDWNAPRLNSKEFTSASTPFIGNPAGPEVIAFYDPNCFHCKDHNDEFQRVIAKWKDRARFTMIPRALWEFSKLQAAALKEAEASGKYFELWQRMFAAQENGKRGMQIGEITALFGELGLDTTNLKARLDALLPKVEEARRSAKIAGINELPAVYIGGRKVWAMNCGEECLGKLIERALTSPAAPAPVATK